MLFICVGRDRHLLSSVIVISRDRIILIVGAAKLTSLLRDSVSFPRSLHMEDLRCQLLLRHLVNRLFRVFIFDLADNFFVIGGRALLRSFARGSISFGSSWCFHGALGGVRLRQSPGLSFPD